MNPLFNGPKREGADIAVVKLGVLISNDSFEVWEEFVKVFRVAQPTGVAVFSNSLKDVFTMFKFVG